MITYQEIIERAVNSLDADIVVETPSFIKEYLDSCSDCQNDLIELGNKVDTLFRHYDGLYYVDNDAIFEDHESIYEILMWFIRELRLWKDSESRTLSKYILIVAAIDILGLHNCKLIDHVDTSIIDSAKEVLSNIRISFNGNESFRSMEKATKERDYGAIKGILMHIDPFSLRNEIFVWISRLLAKFSPDEFANILDNEQDLFKLHSILYFLDFKDMLNISVISKNELVHFLAMYNIQHGSSPRDIQECACSIKELIKRIAEDLNRFRAFNIAYNSFSRVSSFLGEVLAESDSKDLLRIYLNDYLNEIHPSNKRESFRQFCIVFQEKASTGLSNYLFEKSFENWEAWGFGAKRHGKSLFKITLSSLDYAVVKYFVEYKSTNEREAYINQKIDEIHNLRNRWFESETSMYSELYTILSYMQPCLHVAKCVSGIKSAILQEIIYDIEPICEQMQYSLSQFRITE